MALWEAPTTAMVVGVSDGIISASSDGLRTVSRSSCWISRSGTGTGSLVGWDPVQRIRRDVSISSSSVEFRWTWTVHLFSADCALRTLSLRSAAVTKPRQA